MNIMRIFEFNTNEKYIIKNKYNKVDETYFYDNLKIFNKNVKSVKNNGIYVIFNPLLSSKPGTFVYIYDNSDYENIIVYPLSEFTNLASKNDIIINSKKLKSKLILETWNKIVLPIKAFASAKFIEICEENIRAKIRLKQALNIEEELDDFIKEFREQEKTIDQYISPFTHIEENILYKYINREIYEYWNISYEDNMIFASIKDDLKNNIQELKNSKEIKFLDGSIVYLKIVENKIMAKQIKGKGQIIVGKVRLNKTLKDVGKIMDLEKGLAFQNNGGERIVVKRRVSE